MFNMFNQKLPHHPDITTLRKPIWSTWVPYRVNSNEINVCKMAKEKTDYGFEHSHLQIEGHYFDHYGI